MHDEVQSTPNAGAAPTAEQATTTGVKTPAASAPSSQPATEAPAKSSPRAKAAKAPASAVKPASRAKAPARPASKPAAAETPTPAEAPKADKAKKHAPAKPKLVRDSFTLPADDYALFATLKKRALAGKTEVKKSELVRAGLAMLARADDAEFLKAIGLVDRIKTGRPKK